MSSRTKALVNVVLIVLVLLGGAGLFSALAMMKEPPPKRENVDKIFNVEVFTVEAADLQEVVAGFGTARAEHEVAYSAQIAGEIMMVSPQMKVGERVTGPDFQSDLSGQESAAQRLEGDLLLTIDPQVYHQRLTQAETGIAEAEADRKRVEVDEVSSKRLLDRAERDYSISKAEFAKAEKLAADGSITDSQLGQQQLDLQRYEEALLRIQTERELLPVRREQAETKLQRLTADRKLALIEVARTQVRPPFPGMLSEVMVEKGQYVTPGTPLFKVTSIDVVEVSVPLQPVDFSRIADLVVRGEQPLVRLAENESAAPRWTGHVVRIAPQADPDTRTLNVFVRVENQPGQAPLLPGTFVQARIQGPVLRQAVVIPREALPGNGDSAMKVMLAGAEGTASSRSISIVRRIEGLAVVSEGLQSGDQVVMTNLDALRDGARINRSASRTLAEELAEGRLLQPVR